MVTSDEKMSERYFLAICIPTYNMAQWLPELLDSVLQQTQELDEVVQIVISDNASSDNTSELIENYRSHYPHIRYHRHAANQGADRNFLSVVTLAEARYCWLMGGDDALTPGALKTVIDSLYEHQPTVMMMDRLCCNERLNKPVKESFVNLQTSQCFDFSQPAEVQKYLAISNGIGALFSYLSVLVIERQAWQKVAVDEQFIGSDYVHVYMIFSMLFYPIHKVSPRLCYLHIPGVFTRLGNDSFITNGKCKRFIIDVDGYNRFYEYTPQPYKNKMKRVIKKYNPILRWLKYAPFVNVSQREELLSIMKNQSYTSIEILLFRLISLTFFIRKY
ncbi:glycosyltransferase family 2 protein [Photorhabdus sp. APURE]|uniref:glycosyltransferase family 2 protein n=1 Tax=Photorhabdus aballayi TaxID=2991723 RepID=UPI00223E587E|nr:glycosyltransferase family 2 protein [Photorhabdus aballayi]MCW7548263.1 glycosyltransferase family 2 protein [Photorhabdus aballayi]